MNELALFAGAGGGILGGKLLGWRTVCAVEIDSYARKILLARQADGCLHPFPIWDDIKTFDGNPWRGRVDVVSGGFPCQDISAAGKRTGLDGKRSGLWIEMARIVSEVQPAYVWVENSPILLVRGIDRVLWDLAALGYDAKWGIIGAHHAGAPHKRDRIWILAHSKKSRRIPKPTIIPSKQRDLGKMHHLDSIAFGQKIQTFWSRTAPQREVFGDAPICAMDDGMARWVDELGCLGNGQVPAVVRLAWETLISLNH